MCPLRLDRDDGRAALATRGHGVVERSLLSRSRELADELYGQHEDHRSQDESEKAEARDAADDAEKDGQRGDIRPSGDNPRPNQVVDDRDHEDAPDHKERCRAEAPHEREDDRGREPDDGSPDGEHRDERCDHAEDDGRGQSENRES